MLYSTGKSVYSIFYSTLYMYATVILHFSGTPFRESDDPHTFVDLLVSTSTYVFSCLSYIISQHIYFFIMEIMSTMLFRLISLLCSTWQLRSSAYYPQYGIGAFGTLPLPLGNRQAISVYICKSCGAFYQFVCISFCQTSSFSKYDVRYYFLSLSINFTNNQIEGVMFIFFAGRVQKIQGLWA